MAGFRSRFVKSFNILMNRSTSEYGGNASLRTSNARSGSLNVMSRESLVTPIITRIGMDTAALEIKHVATGENGFYEKTVMSGLNERLNRRANKDQTGRMFVQTAIMTLLNKGVMAIVPVDTSINPKHGTKYSIQSMRAAEIVQWYADDVELTVYNDRTGMRDNVTLPKSFVAVVENPLYEVMNSPNSTLNRLVDKLRLLDAVDTESGSGKLDLLIQLPFVIKSEKRKQQAEARRSALEEQLLNSRYGIGYVDAAEKVTQLNRPVENQLMTQVEYLTRMLYSQLGLSQGVFDGSADEGEQLAYNNRTIYPVLNSLIEAMYTTFLTTEAMNRGEKLMYFRDPFKMAPVSEIADSMDKFSRNEIITGNEGRAYLGLQPHPDEKANELRNKNINSSEPPSTSDEPEPKEKGD